MTYSVYGFRLHGDREVRYIGQTQYRGERRLQFLLWEARRMPVRTPFAEWLVANAECVDVFEIAKAPTRRDAMRIEREAISVAAALGQRLFNGDHMPSSLKLNRRASELVEAA